MELKCFPLSEFRSGSHARSLRNGETFSEAVSISKKVPIMQRVHAQGELLSISSVFSSARRQQGNGVNGEGFSLGSLLAGCPGASTFLEKARLIFACSARLTAPELWIKIKAPDWK